MSEVVLREGEQLLKASEVAKLLRVSPAMVYRLLQSGELPAVRIGHAVRVLPSDLDEYVKRCHGADFGLRAA